MSPEVVAFLDRVSKAKLLSNAGQQLAGDDIVRVDNWEEAYRASDSRSWENFITDRHNEMTFGDPNDLDFCDKYDRFVITVRSHLDDILTPIVEKLPITPIQQKHVFNAARWDFLRACVEIEFKEFTDSRWHLEMAEWHLRGHFPCGWEGDWPEDGVRTGKLMVY